MLIVAEEKCDIIRSEMVVAYKLRRSRHLEGHSWRGEEGTLLIASANNEAFLLGEFDTIDQATTCLKELLRREALGCYDFVISDFKKEEGWL